MSRPAHDCGARQLAPDVCADHGPEAVTIAFADRAANSLRADEIQVSRVAVDGLEARFTLLALRFGEVALHVALSADRQRSLAEALIAALPEEVLQ